MSEMNDEKLFINARQLAEIMGISPAMAYEYIKSEQCPFTVVKMGKRYVIPTNSFYKWYDSLNK